MPPLLSWPISMPSSRHRKSQRNVPPEQSPIKYLDLGGAGSRSRPLQAGQSSMPHLNSAGESRVPASSVSELPSPSLYS